jgi:hypothetical protein
MDLPVYKKTYTKPLVYAILKGKYFKVLLKGVDGKILSNERVKITINGKNFTKIIDVEKPEEQWLYPHAYVDYTQKIMYLAYENGKTHYLKKYAFEELGV